MSKALVLFSFALGCVLCACMPEKQLDAAKSVAGLIGSTQYKTGYGVSAKTGKGSHKSITLDFSGMSPQAVNSMTATEAAYMFYKKSKPMPEGQDILDITIEGANSNYEQEFMIDTLVMVEDYLRSTVTTFFNGYLDDNLHPAFDSIRVAIDTSTSDAEIRQFVGLLHRVDSAYGKLTDVNLLNFSFKHLIATKEPILIVRMRAENKAEVAIFRFIVSLPKRKIISAELNPKEE